VARDERHLVYAPTSVKVLGVPQAGLLRALDIPLASLTPFVRKGAALQGSELEFDQYTVFPAPVLRGLGGIMCGSRLVISRCLIRLLLMGGL
jgi:hypothetical protein